MSKEQVAVIILNFKTWQNTLKEAMLVHDLFHLDWKQIIIVDNASPDESRNQLKRNENIGYVFIQAEDNKGYAAGNNIGLFYAFKKGYKYGWILNNDIVIDDESILSEMLRVFEADTSLACVNPDIYAPDGYMFNRYSRRRTFWDYSFGYLAYKKKGRKLEVKDGYGYIWRPQGCCMMVDLEKMKEINYLDENTFLYCEEAILAEKFLKVGYKAACASNIKVIHDHSKTVKSVLKKKEIITIHNKSFEYYLRQYRRFNIVQIKICLCFAAINMRLSN